MKNLLFLCGPNGIGKTTVSKEIVGLLPHSAYVDSDPCRVMNPFVLDDVTIPVIAKNISDLILNYLDCPAVETVIFSYGFHGRRMEVFERVMGRVGASCRFIPFLLWCGQEENIRRMRGRGSRRIENAVSHSRTAYGEVPYPRIDITALSPAEAARRILAEAKLTPFE